MPCRLDTNAKHARAESCSGFASKPPPPLTTSAGEAPLHFGIAMLFKKPCTQDRTCNPCESLATKSLIHLPPAAEHKPSLASSPAPTVLTGLGP